METNSHPEAAASNVKQGQYSPRKRKDTTPRVNPQLAVELVYQELKRVEVYTKRIEDATARKVQIDGKSLESAENRLKNVLADFERQGYRMKNGGYVDKRISFYSILCAVISLLFACFMCYLWTDASGKEITNDTDCHCISISPFFTIEDQNNVNTHIINQQIHRFFCDDSLPSSLDLLENGCWHERIDTQDWKYIIELLFSDFSENRYVSENYLADVLQRESILSFSLQPSVTIAYSMKASSKTVLSIATLEHRIKINSHKTRIVILAAFRLEERTMLFRLINELLYSGANLNDSRFLKTKEEFLDFFERNLE